MDNENILVSLSREVLIYEQKAAEAISETEISSDYYQGVAAGIQHSINIIRSRAKNQPTQL